MKKNFLLKIDFLIYIFILFVLLVYLNLEINNFYLGKYGFHDLGLISDFLSNTIRGKIFIVNDYNKNHLSVNFSPSLIIITPLYYIFESQLITLIISSSSAILSLFPLSYLTNEIFKKKLIEKKYIRLYAIIIIVIYSFNLYFYFSLSSASYVTLFTLSSSYYVLNLYNNPMRYKTIVLLLFSLGLRQDVSIYLCFLILGVVFIKGYKNIRYNYAIIYIKHVIICIAYSSIVTIYILPQLGNDSIEYANKYWGKYGSNWPQLFLSFIYNPFLVFEDYLKSGYLQWNQSFGFFQIFSPYLFLFSSLSGILFFTADSFDRNQLILYNPSFLIPIMYLALTKSFLNIHIFFMKNPKFKYLVILLSFNTYLLIIEQKKYLKNLYLYNIDSFYQTGLLSPSQGYFYGRLFREELKQFNPVASDFNSYVFLPNSSSKFLLHNRDKAKSILIKSDFQEILSGDLLKNNYSHKLEKEGWIILKDGGEFKIYIRK